MGFRVKDLTGNQYGRLTVIRYLGQKGHSSLWICQCSCNGGLKEVSGTCLIGNKTKSCGCLNIERIIERNKKSKRKHGMCRHPLYALWNGIKSRCYNKNNTDYPNYGGKGKIMCDEWLNNPEKFILWAEGALVESRKLYGDVKLEIDKECTKDGNYGPECQFIPRLDNARNKTTTKFVPCFGETIGLSTAIEKYGICKDPKFYRKVYKRITSYGWNIERALTTP